MPDFRIQRTWPGRGFAAGRFVSFVVLFYLLMLLIGRLAAWPMAHAHGFAVLALMGNAEVLLATLLATAILAKLQRRPFAQFGLGGRGALRSATVGICTGAVLLSLLLLILKLCGAFSFGIRIESGLPAIQFALVYAILFGAVAISEETLCRGYALVNLSQAISFWPAVILLSALFGLAHLHNDGENPIGILSAIVYGIVLGYSFLRSGSLWFAIGLHASWDYLQSFVFGVPDSGVVIPGSLMQPIVDGSPWLTGGTAGPEASPLMIGVFVALVLIVRTLLPRRTV